MADFTLYSYWRSSCSYRVRIALELKGLAYDYQSIHLVRDGGEQHGGDYRARNPMGQVPCLLHEGHTLCQSMAIIEYLDVIKPEPALFPKQPHEAARVRQLCEMINAGIQPLQNLGVLQEIGRRFDLDGEGRADWSRHWLNAGFRALETELATSAGRYCIGDTVTAADLLLVPQVYNANRFAINMANYPTIDRINKTALELEAVQRADPAVQPDAT